MSGGHCHLCGDLPHGWLHRKHSESSHDLVAPDRIVQKHVIPNPTNSPTIPRQMAGAYIKTWRDQFGVMVYLEAVDEKGRTVVEGKVVSALVAAREFKERGLGLFDKETNPWKREHLGRFPDRREEK